MISKKILFFILFFNIAFSQNNDEVSSDEKLDKIPLFSNCADESDIDQKNCFINEMTNHIIRNFKYPSKARRKKIQGLVNVLIIIGIDGKVRVLETHAPDGCQLLEEEAIRIINLVPRLEPGIKDGKPISVTYTIPIVFKLID